MPDVIWTPRARAEVEAIEDYYLPISPAFADMVVDGLLASTRRLEVFPLSGQAVPEIADPSIRQVLWRDYRVIYWAEVDRVEVLSVLHTSQQFGT